MAAQTSDVILKLPLGEFILKCEALCWKDGDVKEIIN